MYVSLFIGLIFIKKLLTIYNTSFSSTTIFSIPFPDKIYPTSYFSILSTVIPLLDLLILRWWFLRTLLVFVRLTYRTKLTIFLS